jgi:glucokinase
MAQETFLLADVGGTNTRMALGTQSGLIPLTVTRYRNDEFTCFNDVLHAFKADYADQKIQSAAIAIAGPVVGQTAQLTNRDWIFDKYELAGAIDCDDVRFVNDMSGLARALPILNSSQKVELKDAASYRPNGQAMVIGFGTGVNASALIGRKALAAEIGHTGLTEKMAQIIRNAFGSTPENLVTVEDILSGRGLENLYLLATGKAQSAAEICKAASACKNDTAHNVCLIYGTLLAELIRELALHYLPRSGIYLSGSVARGVLETSAKKQMIDWLAQDRPMVTTLSTMSLSLITDDAAALLGCLEIAKSAA